MVPPIGPGSHASWNAAGVMSAYMSEHSRLFAPATLIDTWTSPAAVGAVAVTETVFQHFDPRL